MRCVLSPCGTTKASAECAPLSLIRMATRHVISAHDDVLSAHEEMRCDDAQPVIQQVFTRVQSEKRTVQPQSRLHTQLPFNEIIAS